MKKLKNFLKTTATNKMVWIAFVVGMLIIIFTSAIVGTINYAKTKSTLANANIDEQQKNIIEQENLTDTSKMSEEQLQKLNEEEIKEKEQKEKEEKNTTTTNKVKNKYYIKVNYGAQVVTVYTYDKNGNYTKPVKAFVCSTGAATPTSRVYRLSWKATWGKLFGNVWGHYCYQIVGDILFHSVPYLQAKNDTLVSAYYDRLGTKDSMGCIRLTTADAKWIYDNCATGTQVEFYSSSNPGPLGKPTAKKVSNAPGDLKNWDPTDPDPKNPWKTYKEENEEPVQNTTNNEITNNENVNNANNNEMNNQEQNTQIENNTSENNQNQNNSNEENQDSNDSSENNTEENNKPTENPNEGSSIETKPDENYEAINEQDKNQSTKEDETLPEDPQQKEPSGS